MCFTMYKKKTAYFIQCDNIHTTGHIQWQCVICYNNAPPTPNVINM